MCSKAMGQQILHFIAKHWYWVAALIVALLLLFFEESKSRAGGARVPPSVVTRMINSEQAVVLDIRDAEAFASGHITGAINLPLADFERNMKRVEKYKKRPIILVCTSGQKSLGLMNKLNKQGFDKVFVLAGGINAWKSASMPLVK